jgi:hypothetical protein
LKSCFEKPSGQFVAADFQMNGHIAENAGKGSDLDGIMVWNGDMVSASFSRDQADMAARLADRFITDATQGFHQFGARQISWYPHTAKGTKLQQADCLTRQYFLSHKMEPDDFWGLALVEMALDGVPHVAAKLVQRFRLRKYGLAKRASRITAFRRLFDQEYQFVHVVQAKGPLCYPHYRQFFALYQARFAPCGKAPWKSTDGQGFGNIQ